MDSEAKRGELKRAESVERSNALARWAPWVAVALLVVALVAGAIFVLER